MGPAQRCGVGELHIAIPLVCGTITRRGVVNARWTGSANPVATIRLCSLPLVDGAFSAARSVLHAFGPGEPDPVKGQYHLGMTSATVTSGPNLVIEGNNAMVLPNIPAASFQMIYIDPPFNTGRQQVRTSLSTTRSTTGGRLGFKGQRYETVKQMVTAYDDVFDDYWSFLEPRLEESWRLLTDSGTLYLHLDYRECHYAKVLLDSLFGRQCFLNEIIWAYDYGARSKKKWPTKHDTILVYVKSPDSYYFNSEEVDREPYMAPGLVTAEKAERGNLPTDVWWHTIVSPTGKEKTGYPTQKPKGIIRRMVQASTRPGDWVLDFFAGSGTLGAVALECGRRFVLVDENPEAIHVMRKRLVASPGGKEIRFVSGADLVTRHAG